MRRLPSPKRCADCDGPLDLIVYRSYFFWRALCATCYQAEQDRPKADAERCVLERMFARPYALNPQPRRPR